MTPAGHQGVTFFGSSGDGKDGYAPSFPAMSPNFVAVGATYLTLDSCGDYESELAWNHSQGGTSPYESEPAYQSGVNTTSYRQTPDVAALGYPFGRRRLQLVRSPGYRLGSRPNRRH